MRYLTVAEILSLHRSTLARTGGSVGLRDRGLLESALAQPRATFGGTDLYPSLIDKATVLGFVLIRNHPFVDGNKRVGHAALEIFLVLNGAEIRAAVDEQEQVVLAVAQGTLDRVGFLAWLEAHVVPWSR